jgi:hypothetical protein
VSLKAIEMQVALPRTHEAGKLQEQLQQRGQLQNDFASDHVKKEENKKKNTVMKQEQKDITRFHKDGNGKEQSHEHDRKREKNTQQRNEPHPYKGTKVDYSG